MARRIVALVLLLTLTASCSLQARWDRYLDERTEFENHCRAIKFQEAACSLGNSISHLHGRWDAILGRVPASDAMWAETETLGREIEDERRRLRDSGKTSVPDELRQRWVHQLEEINQRHALEIAQQFAERERESEARREAALTALVALGLIASQVAATTVSARAPRVQTYRVPTAPVPGSVDPAVRRDLEAQWAVRTGGATGGAKDQYIRDALKQRATETCTYSLNALQGMMVCVDSQGNVRAR